MNLEQTKKLDKFKKYYEIDNNSDCWLWKGGTNNVGYGMIRDGIGMRTAHRVSYELHVGPIPKGKHICHSCDNPKCVNPNHLWVGTHSENMLDSWAKGRHSAIKYANCKYCGLHSTILLIARWHDEKCKHK